MKENRCPNVEIQIEIVLHTLGITKSLLRKNFKHQVIFAGRENNRGRSSGPTVLAEKVAMKIASFPPPTRGRSAYIFALFSRFAKISRYEGVDEGAV